MGALWSLLTICNRSVRRWWYIFNSVLFGTEPAKRSMVLCVLGSRRENGAGGGEEFPRSRSRFRLSRAPLVGATTSVAGRPSIRHPDIKRVDTPLARH